MDKNLHDIEDLFRKGLEDNEDNPSQKMWDGIEKKLDKASVVSIKKKYNFLKKVALLLIFLLAGLSIYVWKNQDKNPIKPDNGVSGFNNETKTKNSDSLTEESGTITLQKRVDSLTINNSRNAITGKFLNSVTAKNLSNTSILKNKIKSKKRDELLLPDASKFPIQKTNKLVKRQPNEVVETKIQNRIEDKRPGSVNTAGIQFDNNLPTIEALNQKNVGDIKNNSTNLFTKKELLQDNGLAKINPIIEIEKTILRKPSIKSTNLSRFAITAFYSQDIAFYHFENRSPGNSNNTNFEKSERGSYSSTLGGLIDYKFSKHWGLQSGITLATSNFNLESETLYAQRDNTGGIKYKLSTPLGDAYVLPSFSNNPNIGDSLFSKSTTHTLQYLGIPLSVKYNFNKGKFTLNVFGGVCANFLTRGQISTELERGNNSEIEKTDKIHGLKPFYFSGWTGIGLDYNVYKNLSLTFSPTLRIALNAINNNVSIASFPKSFGFGLGVKMNL